MSFLIVVVGTVVGGVQRVTSLSEALISYLWLGEGGGGVVGARGAAVFCDSSTQALNR